MENSHKCPLCLHASELSSLLAERYAHCSCCGLRFLLPQYYLERGEEEARYRLHTASLEDEGYQRYLLPLFEAISNRLAGPTQGLDFGSGRAPVLGRMLEKKGHSIAYYDPFFRPDTSVLEETYAFVFTSEVVEHFFNPAYEFQRLRLLTKPGGFLGIMTQLSDGVDFENWYYRRDPSHVAFYSKQTFAWITNHLGWSKMEIIGNRTIILY